MVFDYQRWFLMITDDRVCLCVIENVRKSHTPKRPKSGRFFVEKVFDFDTPGVGEMGVEIRHPDIYACTRLDSMMNGSGMKGDFCFLVNWLLLN